MTEVKFNEADLFLIKNWTEARILENSMENVREKLREILQKVAEGVLEYHESLNVSAEFSKQSWATSGFLMFSCKAWSYENDSLDSANGLWLEGMSLEYLTSEREGDPEAYVWVRSARRAGVNVVAAKRKLWRMIPRLFDSKTRRLFNKFEDDPDCLVHWSFSSTKKEILSWIVAGNTQKLTECIQEQVAIFAKLLPVLDELLRRRR